MQTWLIKLGLIGGPVLLAAEDAAKTVLPESGATIQYLALAMMGTAIATLWRQNCKQTERLEKIVVQSAKAEIERHAESLAMIEALTGLKDHCTAVHEKINQT